MDFQFEHIRLAHLKFDQIKQKLAINGYDFVQGIGEGASASVFLAKSTKYNNFFAIKIVSTQKLIKQETESLIALIHPYVIKLYSTFNDDEYTYLVMEYCHNGTLKQKGILEYEHFVHYAKEILEVLEYCHSQQIVHRDIKPDNIFVDQYDNIKLGDFGLSNKFNNEESARKKCGSLMFCSPEMIDETEYDPFKADIWALGITFFYMITGQYPFTETSVDRLKDQILYNQINLTEYNIDPQIQFLIMKMTSKNPLFRPSAHQLLKLPLFKPLRPEPIMKSISAYSIHNNIKRRSSPYLTFSSDHSDDIVIAPDIKKEGHLRLGKVHSFHRYNLKFNSHKHFIQYE